MIPLAAKIILGGVGYYWLRGKTGQLGPFTPEAAKMAANTICEQFGQLPNASAQEMAAAIGAAAYTVNAEGVPTEFDWPPKWLADGSHKAVWKQLVGWCEIIRTEANAEGMTPCEYLKDPTIPIPPIPAVPFNPGGGIDGPGGIQPGPNPTPPVGPGGLAPTPDPTNVMPTPPSSYPTPGSSYQIQPGDTLFGVVGDAYGTAGATSISVANMVNDHPINRANITYYYPEVGSTEANWFPNGRVSFGAPYQIFYLPVI